MSEAIADVRNLLGLRPFVYFNVKEARVLDGSTKVRVQTKVFQNRLRHGDTLRRTTP